MPKSKTTQPKSNHSRRHTRVTRPHKLVKHAPPRVFKYSNLVKTLYIKSSTPFVSAIKHIDKKFVELEQPKNKKNKTEYISILGMGKNVEKVLSLGLYYQEKRNFKIETLTKSINVVDEFEFCAPEPTTTATTTTGDAMHEDDADENDEDVEYRKRAVSGIEVRIYRSK